MRLRYILQVSHTLEGAMIDDSVADGNEQRDFGCALSLPPPWLASAHLPHVERK